MAHSYVAAELLAFEIPAKFCLMTFFWRGGAAVLGVGAGQ
jgi:hypothetical protein